MPSFADVAARVLPAVVSISTERVVSASDVPAHPFFGAPREGVMRGAGSGFVISGDGFIVTNHHVVEGATGVDVRMSDGEKTYTARVVGRDPETDIALLKVDGAGVLPALSLSNSDAARPGGDYRVTLSAGPRTLISEQFHILGSEAAVMPHQ